MKNNVLLISVVEKCYPEETRVKCQIQEKLKANEFAEALRMTNEELRLGKAHARGIRPCFSTVQQKHLSQEV